MARICCFVYLLDKVHADDGTIIMTPQRYTIYIDQIVTNGNKQDTNTVIALLECALMQLSDDLPFITEVILQSDNAKGAPV